MFNLLMNIKLLVEIINVLETVWLILTLFGLGKIRKTVKPGHPEGFKYITTQTYYVCADDDMLTSD